MTSAAVLERDDTDARLRRLALYRGNRRRFFSDLCYVRDKQSQRVRFELNPAQIALDAAMDQQLHQQHMVRLLVPKARQLGISLYLQLRMLHRVAMHTGWQAFTVAHRSDATRNIFEKARYAYWALPDEYRPWVKASNAQELSFAGMDSSYRVATAGQGDADQGRSKNTGTGRSFTNHLLHLSEAAYYANAADLVSGMLDTVPEKSRTEVAIESTGAGVGGTFYEMVMAVLAGELPGWQVKFLPWTMAGEYRRTPEPGWRAPAGWEDYAERHGLTLEQTYWAYCKNAEKARLRPSLPVDEPSSLFRQEFPVDVTECFQQDVGDQLIRPDLVLAARQRQREPDETAPIVLGLDVGRNAGQGDPSVLIDRQGRRAGHLMYERWWSDDTMHTVGRVVRAIQSLHPQQVFIDLTGIGAGVYDRLVDLGYGEIATGVHFGSTETVREPDRFPNKRTEMWVKSLEWLKDDEPDLIDDARLQESACSVRHSFDSAGRYKLEDKAKTKQRLQRSPDEWDAVALTFAEEVASPAIMAGVVRRDRAWNRFVGT